ncbi:MAG: ATP-binding protein [Chloroflexi bacterium]|nr:ATP-binding protein [Chloroflexota bacterium]MCY3894888.1 ATP-binding protein [Chloroflexota bacterium]
MLEADIGAIAKRFPATFVSEPDVIRYAAEITVWGRWFVVLIAAFQFIYRPGFWYYGHFEYWLLLVPLVAFNGLAHYRLLTHGSVTWRWLLLLSTSDLSVATVGVILQGGFVDGFVFLGYFPALAVFVVIFTSLLMALAWTTITASVYTLVCATVGPGLDLVAGHEKELLVRIAAMYSLVLCVSLITRFERSRWRAAVDRERTLQHERVELVQSIHDTTAQSAYMIGLGIDAARRVAGDSNEELTARLDATSRLSKTAIWQLRHPIDIGRIFKGRELGRTLDSHVSTFTSITSVPAELIQHGVEPPLSIEARSLLFSIAHNALTNAFRHADASSVLVELDFGEEELSLSVSDDGVGLPADYADRGHGFANMRTYARRLGGRLIVEPRGTDGGARVACVMPLGRGRREK